METWSFLFRRFLLFVVLSAIACGGGEGSLPRDTPPPTLESPSAPKATKIGGNQQAADPDAILELFKVAIDGEVLVIPVEIQSKRYWFAVDTGASISVYDKSFRSVLGTPIKSVKIWTPGQFITAPIYRSPNGHVGKLPLPTDSECFCLDLGKMPQLSNQKVHGILGMDFLRKHVVRIDVDNGELTFLRAVGANPGHRIPLVFRGNSPEILIEVQGLPRLVRFLVDTGCEKSGNLEAEVFDILAKRDLMRIVAQSCPKPNSGSKSERLGCVHEIKLGGFHHEKLLFQESNKNVLGLGWLSRYLVTFDFPKSTMYLKKGRQFDQPELHFYRSGLYIRRGKGEILVIDVSEGSPAAQAGLKPLDVLLKIDDSKTSDMSTVGIYRNLSQKGRKYRLLVRRGEKELEMTMHLAD